jgi:macrolide-specific efflux system membrane fusion protein
VVTIADTSGYTISASVPEADIASVQVGQAATVTLPAVDDTTVDATVYSISPTGTTSNSVVTFATVIKLDSVPDGARIGSSATATITTASSATDALYVPSAAITTDGDTSTVDVVDDSGNTSTVPVTTGLVGDEGTVITSGLTAGQRVVIGTVSEESSSNSSSSSSDSSSGSMSGSGGMSGMSGSGGEMPQGGMGGGPGGN